MAAANRITALAAALHRDGVPGGLDLLRAQVFLGLLLGHTIAAPAPDHETTRPGGTGAGGVARGAEPRSTGHPSGAAARTHGPHGTADEADRDGCRAAAASAGGPGGSNAPGHGPAPKSPIGALVPAGAGGAGWAGVCQEMPRAGSINLTVPLATWLGLAAAPGQLAGYGPVPAETARHLAAGAAGDPATRWCLTITGPGGQAVAHGCARPRRLGRETTRAADHRVATKPPGPPATGGATARPAAAGWSLAITVRELATAECSHWRESASYVPPRSLRHVIEIRDQTCVFPGCRRPAVTCDKDHTLAHDRGGRTCECNLGNLCRFHHRVKQAPGWQLTQPAPGVFIWTTPSGWRYTNAPHLLR